MDPIRKIPKKFTKKFVNKVINRQYFHRKTGLYLDTCNSDRDFPILGKDWGKDCRVFFCYIYIQVFSITSREFPCVQL